MSFVQVLLRGDLSRSDVEKVALQEAVVSVLFCRCAWCATEQGERDVERKKQRKKERKKERKKGRGEIERDLPHLVYRPLCLAAA